MFCTKSLLNIFKVVVFLRTFAVLNQLSSRTVNGMYVKRDQSQRVMKKNY